LTMVLILERGLLRLRATWRYVRVNTLCFLIQQSVEMSMKAVLVLTGTNPKTSDFQVHKLHLLMDLLGENNVSGVPVVNGHVLLKITNYALKYRYPGLRQVLTAQDDFVPALEVAGVYYQWAKERLGEDDCGAS
jgi:HEPN domain-containing protein